VRAALGPDGLLQQNMLLAEYALHENLLNLSSTAKYLHPFRFHLNSLCLRGHLNDKAGAVSSRIVSLLQGQRRLEHVRIEAARLVVPAVTSLLGGVSRGYTLRSLHITAEARLWLTPQECQTLCAALNSSGACPSLRIFSLSLKMYANNLIRGIAESIRGGALHVLDELDLHVTDYSPAVVAVVEALAAGGGLRAFGGSQGTLQKATLIPDRSPEPELSLNIVHWRPRSGR
jgi:hypothetical protein